MGYIKKYSDKRLISKKKEQEESALFFEKAIQIFQEHPYSIESNKYISNIVFKKRIYYSIIVAPSQSQTGHLLLRLYDCQNLSPAFSHFQHY